ncbi:MAG: sulfotransferase [Dehalococcoidia bacterium]|nr:sulfotransferase [Dehalococcoidia bacterium]
MGIRGKAAATSTDYAHPHRPLPVRAYNLVGRAAARLGWGSGLDVDALLASTQRKTGLSDFGADGPLEALRLLVGSINGEAELTPTGRLVQKSRLSGALIQRLRIQDLLRRHPEILDIDLGSVILIAGLQRTGTTLLHRLLFRNPDIDGVMGVEAIEPLPAGAVQGQRSGASSRQATLAQRGIRYLSPDFNAIHPIDPAEPEEDILLLDLSFMSQTPEATMHVPAYSRWLEEQDHTSAYSYLHRVLQVLRWQRPGKNLVLKTPHHMEYLDIFLKAFPAALVVQTHRDPRKTLPSFCSMVAHGRGIFSDRVDPVEIAAHWTRKTRRMVDLTMQTRDRANADQFLDVSYYDLLDDPIGELRRITERAGIGFDEEAQAIAEQYLEAHPQNQFGRHRYHMSDFGLDEETIDREFAAYRARHAIPVE